MGLFMRFTSFFLNKIPSRLHPGNGVLPEDPDPYVRDRLRRSLPTEGIALYAFGTAFQAAQASILVTQQTMQLM